MSGWYYKREDGKVVGIFSEDEIKHCAERGGIAVDTLVMHEEITKGEWVTASRVAGLRSRIEACAQEAAAAETSSVIKGYVPARPSWTSRVAGARHTLEEMAGWLVRVSWAIAGVFSAKSAAFVCATCERSFERYDTPGRCPLCGQWEKLMCLSCGLASGAQRFLEANCRCPRCGTKVFVPGVQSNTWRAAGLVAVSLLIILVMGVLVTAGILASPPTTVTPNGVEIVAVQPNPEGRDQGLEQVTIKNGADHIIDLAGWRLQDRAGDRFWLAGLIPRNGKLVITMTEPTMPLENNGDEVFLIDPEGVARSRAAYNAEQGRSGRELKFTR